jgi:glycosyltransferase involved in cell wall biosynthesis
LGKTARGDDLVSVIVPVFNHEKFIVEALHSVVRQTYRNIELIVIDDCSKDNSYSLALKFLRHDLIASRFRRIEIRRNSTNLGAPATLNAGMRECRGTFLTFLNSDDFFMPDRISRLVDACGRDSLALAFSAVLPIDRDGKVIQSGALANSICRDAIFASRAMPSISFGFLGKQLTATTGNIFVGRSLAEKIGEFANFKYCHDWDYMLRAITITEPKFIPEFLYGYRLHGNNTFLKLGDIASQETNAVLDRYFGMINSGQCHNMAAPTRDNWPMVFEHFAAKFGTLQPWLISQGIQSATARTRDRHNTHSR